jgi:nitrogen regulatory protein PII
MTTRKITVLTDVALITCIVQRGVADRVIAAARAAGAQGATIHFAKGMGVRERLGILGVAVNVEKEVIQIVVSNDQIERVFEAMYLAGNLDTPAMGMMYITPLEKAATYIPLEVLEKLSDAEAPEAGAALGSRSVTPKS